jgi:sugar/nucleoside kinase (ribokinase family)
MTGNADTYVVAFGDLILQLVSHQVQESRYDRTLVVDWSAAVIGGAVWNVAWYLHHLGRETRLRSHYGPDAIARIASQTGWQPSVAGSVCKQTSTDRLILFPNVRMPSIYLTEPLTSAELNVLCGSLAHDTVLVFAGTRHAALRTRYLEALPYRQGGLTVFSPSYSVYDYTMDELEAFLAGSDITFVNEREAAFLCAALGETDSAGVMTRGRIGGVVTRAEHGAELYLPGAPPIALQSTSGVTGDIVGTGEAFLCGFLEAFLRTGDFLRAGAMGIAVSAQTARDGRICTPVDAARAQQEAGLS